MQMLGDRVKKARLARGLSAPKLAKLAGGISYQAIQQLENGDSRGTKHLVAIARALNVSPDWLETGAGSMDEAGRDWSGPTVKASKGAMIEIAGEDFARLPVYDIRFAAGAGAQNDDESPIDHYLISVNLLRSLTHAPLSEIGVFQVDGDSMEPTINTRDWVFVDRGRTRLTNPGIYALNFEGDALVKRASQHLETNAVTLISDNPKYPAQTIKKPDRLIVVGRVFLSLRRL